MAEAPYWEWLWQNSLGTLHWVVRGLDVGFRPIADVPNQCETLQMDAAELFAREALERLSDLLAARDFAFVDEFDPSSALLIGSEEGEVASTRAEMRSLLASVYALPVRIGWEWDEVVADSSGDVVWVYAEGRVAMAAKTGVEHKPYRMSGVLHRSNGRWLWRILSRVGASVTLANLRFPPFRTFSGMSPFDPKRTFARVGLLSSPPCLPV